MKSEKRPTGTVSADGTFSLFITVCAVVIGVVAAACVGGVGGGGGVGRVGRVGRVGWVGGVGSVLVGILLADTLASNDCCKG